MSARTASFDPAAQPRSRKRERVGYGLVLIFVYVAIIASLWGVDYLPQQDLPAHAGLIALRHRFAASAVLQQYFTVHESLGSYAVFRGLGELTYSTLGPLGCVRLFATLPFVLTPISLLWMQRRLFGNWDITACLLGALIAFGFMFVMGFASFLLGLPLWVLAATEVLVLVNGPPTERLRSGVALTLLALALQFIHGYPLLMLVVFAALAWLLKRTWRNFATLVAALAPAVGWLLVQVFKTATSNLPSYTGPLPKQGIVFQGPLDKLSLLITPTLMTRFGVDSLVSVVLWIALAVGLYRERMVLFAVRESAQPPRADAAVLAHRRTLAWFAASAFVLFLALPHSIGWFGFADGRLLPPIIVAAYFALSNERRVQMARLIAFGTIVLAAVLLVATHLFQGEARESRAALDRLPAGARVLNLPIEPNSRYFVGHPFVHYDKLVLLERDIVPSDVWFQVATAVYPTDANPALHLPDSYIESNLHNFQLSDFRLEEWTHLLVRASFELQDPRLRCERVSGPWQVCEVSQATKLTPPAP